MMGEAENSKLFVLACWSMTSVGLVIGSLGPLLVPISDTFHLRLAQMGLPIVSYSTGFLSVNIFLAFFWKIHRTRIFLGLSSLVASLTLASISLVRTPLLLLAILFFVGTSQGLLHTTLDCFFSEISGEERARPWLIGPLSEALGLARGVFLVPLLCVGLAGIFSSYVFLLRPINDP